MKKIILLILSILLLAGCQSFTQSPTPETTATPSPQPTLPPLVGSEWILTGIQGKPPIPNTFITLEFKEDSLSGSAGCNSYGGKYSLPDGRLKIEEIVNTLAACLEPEGVMDQEAAYLKTLQDAALVTAAPMRVSEDSLEILNALGQSVLTYRRKPQFAMNPADLIGTAWRLENAAGQKPAWNMTLVLLNDHEFSGFAGCRHFFGNYQAAGDDIRLTSMTMLGADCGANQALTRAEGEYTTLLSTTTDYRLEANRLILLQSSGQTATFAPLPAEEEPSLDGTTWQLAGIILPGGDFSRVTPLWPGTAITAAFADGKLSGSAGCNNYFAAYAVDTGAIQIEGMGATKKLCAEPAELMRQETLYLEILQKAQTLQRFPGQLWLATGDGRSLFFVAPPGA